MLRNIPEETRQRSEAPRQNDWRVERHQRLDACRTHFGVQIQVSDRLAEERRLPLVTLDTNDSRLWPADGDDKSREACARPEVDSRAPVPDEFRNLQAIFYVSVPEVRDVCGSDEVDSPIPGEQEPGVLLQSLLCFT